MVAGSPSHGPLVEVGNSLLGCLCPVAVVSSLLLVQWAPLMVLSQLVHLYPASYRLVCEHLCMCMSRGGGFTDCKALRVSVLQEKCLINKILLID